MKKPLHAQVAEVVGWTCVHPPGEHCGDILLPDPEKMRWKGKPPGCLIVGPMACQLIPRYDEDWSAMGPVIASHVKFDLETFCRLVLVSAKS